MDYNYKGMNVEKDLPGQVEFNRRKNVQQDQRIDSLETNVQQLITQVPAGYLPRVYYGLVRGTQTYRFVQDYVFSVSDLDGVVGDAYGLISTAEIVSHINAIATQINETQLKIVIQGDYTIPVTDFNLVNQRTGYVQVVELGEVLSLQDASYLGSYDAQENQGKQITVLHDEEFNDVNVTFASADYSGDGIYNWVRIGNFVNGVDGRSIYALTNNTAQAVFQVAKINDLVVAGEPITYEGLNLAIGDLKLISSINPLTFEDKGNIRGATGSTGATGASGADGLNGLTPEIVEGYWHIGDVNTGVKALGVDGTDGEDGKAFAIQSGLYSVPTNVGQTGNTDAEGNALLTLPVLPQVGITGKGYIVYDPITTPLQPYYDLYYANDGDASWTIIHPFNGINGRNGSDGLTPYIQNNNWFIGNTNTGVPATGPQGPKGDKGVNYMGGWIANNEYYEDDLVTYEGSSFICIQAHSASSITPNNDANNWILFASKGDTGATGATGATGPTGATPSIAVNATALPAGSQPTATRTGTDANPIVTFGIPGAGASQATFTTFEEAISFVKSTPADKLVAFEIVFPQQTGFVSTGLAIYGVQKASFDLNDNGSISIDTTSTTISIPSSTTDVSRFILPFTGSNFGGKNFSFVGATRNLSKQINLTLFVVDDNPETSVYYSRFYYSATYNQKTTSANKLIIEGLTKNASDALSGKDYTYKVHYNS